MATGIKICGIRRKEDVEYVNEAKPDYIGFIFVKGKRRYVEPARALRLRQMLDPGIRAAGVFIDAPPEEIVRIVKSGAIQAVQLHGSEDNAYIAALRRQLEGLTGAAQGTALENSAAQDAVAPARPSRIPIIQAFRIRTEEDLQNARKSEADYVLLDNGTGTGKTFDWEVLENAGAGRPYILAGGLSPENLEEAITRFQPYAVDLSSGVETDGFKDREKIAAAVKLVRTANAYGATPDQAAQKRVMPCPLPQNQAAQKPAARDSAAASEIKNTKTQIKRG